MHRLIKKPIILSLLSMCWISLLCSNPLNYKIAFYDSMSVVSDKIPLLKENKEWQKIKELYDLYILKKPSYKKKRIPKIIHQIWLGSAYPKKYKTLQKTWLEKHPDWQYILWTDQEIEHLKLINKKMYDDAPNYGAKSDIARYEILYRFGGLYVDTDFECIHPFDPLNHSLDFYTGMAYGPSCTAYVALIGAVPGHPILKECIETLNIKHIAHTNPAINTLFTTGPYHFSKALNKYIKMCTDACVAFPVGYFYPWPNFAREQNSREQIKKWIRPETFAIHHWHVSWNEGIAP